MKRYVPSFNLAPADSLEDARMVESAAGEWARRSDLLKLKAVVDALPRCDECGLIATQNELGAYQCDKHGGYMSSEDLPYADALRALEKKPT